MEGHNVWLDLGIWIAAVAIGFPLIYRINRLWETHREQVQRWLSSTDPKWFRFREDDWQ